MAVLMMAGLCSAPFPSAAAAVGDGEFRGLWVSTVINLDYPSKPGLSSNALKREADTILNNAAAMGFNAILFQVRPTGDALYKSSVYPWSSYLSGTQGSAPDGGFDPLAYFTEGAHSRGMELHAWINPFRVARNESSVDALSADNPARLHPDWVVAHTDGNLYYDPGLPEVRTLVQDGVLEIIQNYDVDGVHFDDYFYPGKSFADASTFAAHGAGQNIEDWRRENINSLIRETGEAIHALKPDVRFGVSPQAIWAHQSSSPYGSNTDPSGNQTYYQQYADTRKWVLAGWLDYIAPQIYWEIGHARSDYKTVLDWWCELVRGTEVDLYVGHATYMSNGYGSAAAWKGTDEIKRQIDMARTRPEYKGSIHFRYNFVANDAAIAAAVKALHGDGAISVMNAIQTVMPPVPHGTLSIGRPAQDTTVSFSHFYIMGASDPSQPLYVNGTEVTNRTDLGYYSYYTPLKSGENRFVFSQGQNSVTRIITVPAGGSGAAKPNALERAEITAGSAFPELYDEIRAPGESVTLRCTAPIGATVTVRVGGVTIPMTPARSEKPDGNAVYATSFTASYTLPARSGQSGLTDCGKPVYTMRYGRDVINRRATGSLVVAGEDAPLTAEVTADAAFVYPGATTSGGPIGELCRGQTDSVQKQQGGQWVLLGSGQWMQSADLRLTNGAAPVAKLTGIAYSKQAKWDTLLVQTDTPAATSAVWNGKNLRFTVHHTEGAPVATLPGGALMGTVTASYDGYNTVYTLTPDDPLLFHGHYVELRADGIALHIKRKPQIAAGGKPLTGFQIVVDAGHGGTDAGAHGAFGSRYAEKNVNLYAALKLSETLRSLGAQVSLTRSEDLTVDPMPRLQLNREKRPDLFISLHCNSMEHDVNSDTIRGISLFYRETVAEDFSKKLYENVWRSLGLGSKGTHKANLYVCRGFWAPSVIVEMGFINNPWDYEWLTDDTSQNRLIAALTDGIVQYFS